MAKVKNETPKKAVVNSKDEISDEKLHESKVMDGKPPSHSVELVVLIACACLIMFPSMEEIDEIASVRILTRRIFHESVSISALAYSRFMLGVFILGVSLQMWLGSNGWVQITHYLPGSKLLKCDLVIKGWKTLCPFTSVSWNLLGIYNLLSAGVAYQVALGQTPSPAVMRLTIILWETAAPCTLLVASVVRYGIWPNAIKQGGNTDALKHPRILIMHNANVLIALIEIALLGGLPLRFSEMALAPLYGILYVLFSWNMRFRWAAPDKGPQFLYFFFDTTQGWTTTIALIALLVVLLLFYVIMALSIRALNLLGGENLLWNTVFIAGICSVVCRFRD